MRGVTDGKSDAVVERVVVGGNPAISVAVVMTGPA